MAGRGRQRKLGQTRADAAIDAMKKYGFSLSLVKKTIDELLEIYTEDGWALIEEDSYRVLTERILEIMEEKEQEKKDNSSQDDEAVPKRITRSVAGTSAEPLVPLSMASPVVDMDVEPANEALPTALLINDEALGPALLTYESGEASNSWKDININQDSERKLKNGAHDPANGSCHSVASNGIHSPHLDSHPPKQCKPYHGWISDGECNEEDLIELEPAPLPADIVELLIGTDLAHLVRKRKSSWDEKPDDL